MILAAMPHPVISATFWSSLGLVDVLLALVFLLGVFFGIRKGLSGVLPGLIAMIMAQIIVIEYAEAFGTFLASRFQMPFQLMHILMFVTLATVSVLLIHFLFKLLSIIASIDFKQPLNHLGGALAGALQFILLLALVSQFVMLFGIPFIEDSLTKRSLSGPYLIQISGQVHYIFERWIPASLRA